MNIKSQAPTIRSYGTPSIFSGTNLWTLKNNPNEDNKLYWYFNDQYPAVEAINNFAPNYSATLFTGKGSFQKNLDLLNERINTIHKQLSYWDLYKITDTVLKAENFPAIISGLAVGNSAVVNCDTFTYMNQKYRRGDVIVKISDSNEILIPAINQGVFKPISMELRNGSYILTYKYREGLNPDESVVPLSAPIATDGNAIYGQSFELDTAGTNYITAEFFTSGSSTTVIKPVAKTFIKKESSYEEIVLDQDFAVDLVTSTTPNQWKFALLDLPQDSIICIQVK